MGVFSLWNPPKATFCSHVSKILLVGSWLLTKLYICTAASSNVSQTTTKKNLYIIWQIWPTQIQINVEGYLAWGWWLVSILWIGWFALRRMTYSHIPSSPNYWHEQVSQVLQDKKTWISSFPTHYSWTCMLVGQAGKRGGLLMLRGRVLRLTFVPPTWSYWMPNFQSFLTQPIEGTYFNKTLKSLSKP